MNTVPLLKHILGEEFMTAMDNSIKHVKLFYPQEYLIKNPYLMNSNNKLLQGMKYWISEKLAFGPVDGTDMMQYCTINGAIVLASYEDDDVHAFEEKVNYLGNYIKDKTYCWIYADDLKMPTIVLSLPRIINGIPLNYGDIDSYVSLLETLKIICKICTSHGIYEKRILNYCDGVQRGYIKHATISNENHKRKR
jgi:hypothetical protein